MIFPGDAASAQHVVSYFTPVQAPQSLGIGDTLTFSFDFTPTAPASANAGWRIAVLNTGGARVTADTQTISNASYTAWTGYAIMVNPASSAGAQFWKRSGTSSTLIASTGAYSALGTSVDSQAFSAGTTYTCVMTITRTVAGVDLAVNFSGGTLASYTVTSSDTSAAFTSFDALAMSINRNGTIPAFGSLRLDHVYVAYSPLLDDQFADGERITQDFPTSAAWITSAAGTSLAVTGQQLVFPGDSTGPQHIVTYFTPAGTTRSLGLNERLTASFAFRVTAPIDVGAGWRMGLFNSGGLRVTADAQSTAHPSFNGWTGYATLLNPGGTTPAQFWERTGVSDTLIVSVGAFSSVGSAGTCQPLSAGTDYTGKLTLSRTAAGLVLALEFGGGELSGYAFSALDESPSAIAFDAIAMTINRSGTVPAVGSLTLDDVTIAHEYLPALAVAGVTVDSKVYDGSTAAALNMVAATLVGVASGDVVTLNTSGAIGAFDTASAGIGKLVMISGLTLGGPDAGKYCLSDVTSTGAITARPLAISGITANDKTYDGTTSAVLSTSGAALNGVLGGDPVTLNTAGATGTFADASVGVAKPVTISGLALGGAAAANYYLLPAATTAAITAKQLAVSGMVAYNKIYDGSPTAVIDSAGAVLNGIVNGDTVTLLTTGAISTFPDAAVGTGKTVTITGLALDGADAAKYFVSDASATAAITVRTVTVSGITAANKVYDGTTLAVVDTSAAALEGVLGADAVALNTTGASGSFADSAVGTAKLVTIVGLTLSGEAAGNYVLPTPQATAIADITPVPAGDEVLNETFSDGERNSQDLPSSAAWFTSTLGTSLTVANQQLVFAGDNASAQHIVSYFTTPGAPVDLAVGENITVSFNFVVSNPINTPAGLRFGLLNSLNSRVTSDAAGASNASYTDWTGYVAWLNPAAASDGARFAERTAASSTLITSGTAYTTIDPAAPSQTLVAGTLYSATLSLSRTGTSTVELELSVTGGALSNYTLTATDTTAGATSFDAFVFAINRSGSTAAVSQITLDNVTVDASTPPLVGAAIPAAYEMLGNPVFGCTQADQNDDKASKQTFTVMKTGRLYNIAFQTQGARANRRWGDAHAGGHGGHYRVRVYTPAPGGSVASTGATDLGNPQGNMTLRGANPGDWYPSAVVGGTQVSNIWTAQYKGSAPSSNQTIASSASQYVGGTHVQSWIVRADSTTVEAGTPPAGWAGTRAENTSICYVDLLDTAGNAGIPVTAGEVLCISYENQDGSPNTHFTHNNEAHARYAPVPGYTGISTPLDPNLKCYYNRGNRDWRKVPHFGVNIDGTWYGQPYYMLDGSNTATDDTAADGMARLMYGSRYSRQVITPKAGYNRTVSKLWVNAVRWTGKTNYTNDGVLEVRIRRAPLTSGTPVWTQYWPASGWSPFPAGTFAASSTVLSGGKLGDTQVTDLSLIAKYGVKTFSPGLTFDGNHHYAIELRVAPGSSSSAFYIQACINPGYYYIKGRPTGAVNILDNYPSILAADGSGQGYNRAETSSDGGSNWTNFYRTYRIFPIALEPEPLP